MWGQPPSAVRPSEARRLIAIKNNPKTPCHPESPRFASRAKGFQSSPQPRASQIWQPIPRPQSEIPRLTNLRPPCTILIGE
jgi:hypothetical protein